MQRTSSSQDQIALPDFCQPQALLLLVLLGLLLAIMLTLAGIHRIDRFWLSLGLVSVLVQSVLLSACLLLCGGRNVLVRLPVPLAFGLIFAFIQLLTVLYSWFAVVQFPVLLLTEPSMSIDYFILRNVAISMIASLVFLRYLVLHRQWQLQVKAESSARLSALQARIRPHFLFNALNTVASLIRSKPEQAEEAVLDLSDLLRTGLREQGEHTLAEELDLIRGYLRIEALRLGDRLNVEWSLDEDPPLDAPIPALLIQPLIENAIQHGIARRADGGTLRIHSTWHKPDVWQITISNPLGDEQSRKHTGHGLSLDNIEKRLMLAFEGRARLDTQRSSDAFCLSLHLPVGSA